MVVLRKKLRKLMAKNKIKRGKSMRNGNLPSPYQKYGKTPYVYSESYRQWKLSRIAGRVLPAVSSRVNTYRPQYKEAAE
jgi:hypothetical protein